MFWRKRFSWQWISYFSKLWLSMIAIFMENQHFFFRQINVFTNEVSEELISRIFHKKIWFHGSFVIFTLKRSIAHFQINYIPFSGNFRLLQITWRNNCMKVFISIHIGWCITQIVLRKILELLHEFHSIEIPLTASIGKPHDLHNGLQIMAHFFRERMAARRPRCCCARVRGF